MCATGRGGLVCTRINAPAIRANSSPCGTRTVLGVCGIADHAAPRPNLIPAQVTPPELWEWLWLDPCPILFDRPRRRIAPICFLHKRRPLTVILVGNVNTGTVGGFLGGRVCESFLLQRIVYIFVGIIRPVRQGQHDVITSTLRQGHVFLQRIVSILCVVIRPVWQWHHDVIIRTLRQGQHEVNMFW